MNAGPRVTCRVDHDGQILSCKIVGDENNVFDHTDLTGISVSSTMPKEEAETFLGLIRHTIDTGEATTHVHRYIQKPQNSYLRHVEIRRESDTTALLLVHPYS